MSDWGICQSNLDDLEKIDKQSPLTDRELYIAAMQFDYTGTSGMESEFKNHPIIKKMADLELIWLE